MIITIIKFSCEINVRMHIINIKNDKIVLNIFRNLFEKTDLSIIDIFYREINRFNLIDFFDIEEYSQHLKKHKKNILNAKKKSIIDK